MTWEPSIGLKWKSTDELDRRPSGLVVPVEHLTPLPPGLAPAIVVVPIVVVPPRAIVAMVVIVGEAIDQPTDAAALALLASVSLENIEKVVEHVVYLRAARYTKTPAAS
jgi:hypothetical protein